MCPWICATGSGRGGAGGGSMEPAKGRERRWIRPINLAIVANQDQLGRGSRLRPH